MDKKDEVAYFQPARQLHTILGRHRRTEVALPFAHIPAVAPFTTSLMGWDGLKRFLPSGFIYGIPGKIAKNWGT